MTLVTGLEIGLGLLILGVAWWTIVTRQTYASVVGFVVYGLLMSLAWVCLASADIALTEAAIGSGVTGALFLGACARLRNTEAAAEKERLGRFTRLIAMLICAGVAVGLAAIVLLLPEPAPTLAVTAQINMPVTGLGNPVTAVLLAFRAFDTFLEAVVLLLALIGVWALAPDELWGGRPGPQHQPDREGVLVFLAQVLVPVGIIAGVYLFWVGADKPGGAFQGGTVLGAMWILAMIAGLTDPPPISRWWMRALLVAGPVIFLTAGIAGFLVAGGFLSYPEAWAKPIILAIEAALTLSIGATLGLLVAGSPERTSQS